MASVSLIAKYFTIKTACAILPDQYLLDVASIVELRNQPMAQFMLEFYLSGKGKTHDIKVKTEVLLKEDLGVYDEFRSNVLKDLLNNKNSGIVPIPQKIYKNQEWRNALGSINLQWRKISSRTVEVWFVNLYRWHPTDTRRMTQCVHQAADNLKAKGAAEFKMIGEHILISF